MHLPLIHTLTSFFLSVRELVGRKIYLFLVSHIILGFVEGLGLALLIPLFLVFLDDNSANNSEWLVYIKNIFEFFSISYSNERFLILVVFIFLTSRCLALIGYRIDAHLFARGQAEIYRKILKSFERMQFPYFNKYDAGYFNNLLQNETIRTIAAIQYYIKALNHLILTTVLFFLAISNNFIFTISIVGFAGIVIFAFSRISRRTKKISYDLSLISSRFQSLSIEYLNNFKYLISTNTFPSFVPYLNSCSKDVIDHKYKIKVLTDSLGVFTMMVLFPGMVAIIYLFIKVLHFPIEGVLVSLIVCQRALSKALSFQSSWQYFNNVFGSYKFFTKSILEANQNFERREGRKIDCDRISIQLKNVAFAYNQDFKLEIDDLQIPANSIVSLVGHSGSGKTSILDLIAGVYLPQTGVVNVNEVDYTTIHMGEYRNHIGLVNQESSLFNDTIFNNVSSWAEDTPANREEVHKACVLANIEEFILSLEEKYDTIIGDKGTKVSGGQRQRLAIARELYKKPSLLLLDEATSALDSESEARIKQTIDSLRGKMTIVIVAHRLSTVRNSDKIIVMENGRVIQTGTFDELIAEENSRFKELVNNQLIKE